MSTRFNNSRDDSRYNPRDRDRDRDRDRSPPNRFERRASSSSGPIRNSDNSYRPGESTPNSRDVTGAPRGPSRGGGTYAGRGKGYTGRDTRDSRDSRDNQFYRRESDRDFSRRDTDRRSPPSRNRSRTPPSTRDFRDARDHRDAQLRSLDVTRVARDARDNGPTSATSTTSETNSSSSTFRGGLGRSRGRGDWDRGNNRRNFDERDSFRARSRSRDRWDGDRDRDRDRDRDYDRDTRRDEDTRDRDNERGRRDPPTRPESRNSVSSQPTSTSGAPSDKKEASRPPPFLSESSRRSSTTQPINRPDVSRSSTTVQTPSFPMSYPQVPEFGGFKPSTASPEIAKMPPTSFIKEDISTAIKTETADPTKIAPKGPKADLTGQQPTGPKVFPRRPGFPEQSPATRRFDDSSAVPSPSGSRFGPSGSPTFSATPLNRPRNPTWSSPELNARPKSSSAPHHEPQSIGEMDTPSRPADIKIPTGPKLGRDSSMRTPLSARSSKSGTVSWANANSRNQSAPQPKPSIMQSMHHRKEDEYSVRPLTSPSAGDARRDSRSSGVADINTRRASADMMAARRLTLSPGAAPSAIQGLRGDDLDDDDDDEDAIDDDDEDDEDNLELDQQDFERTEAKFQKQIESLQSKLAPSPRLNPKILTALETIDIYASAILDYENGYVPTISTVEKDRPKADIVLSPALNSKPTRLPTPPAEPTQIKSEEEKEEIKDATIMINLSLDGLTWLEDDPLTPASFDFLGSEAEEEALCNRIRQKLAIEEDEDEQLREIYKDTYLKWREDVDTMDEENVQQEVMISRAATPLSAVGTETAGTPVPDGGRRTTRNATEMDIERIMKESAEEAQAAEQAQVIVDMSVDPDMSREADIPDMLTEEDQEMFLFEDLNNRIPVLMEVMIPAAPEDNPVFKAYDYLPPMDDFDEDDQERFKDAYAKFPKQWGFLANHMNIAALQMEAVEERLPIPKKRDYHQCILHYYMTKKQAKPPYKALPNRKSRGRKKGAASRRGPAQRSSMLGGGEDGALRVTDTGRPKRAAAPSFNDKEKREAEALAQKAAAKDAKEKKAATMLNKPAGDGTATAEKTPAKRVRKKEGEKTTKRNAKPTALAPNVSPARPTDRGPGGGEIQMQNVYRSQDMEGAKLLAELHQYPGMPQSQQPSPFPAGSQNETWRIEPRAHNTGPMLNLPGGAVVPPQTAGMSVMDPNLPQHGAVMQGQAGTFMARQLSPGLVNAHGPGSNQSSTPGNNRGQNSGTSSYWSVQEQNQFLDLIKSYGKDWAMISKYLPSKSEIMIKNYYTKAYAHDTRVEGYAAEAERRNARDGPPMGMDPPAQLAPPTGSNQRRRGNSSNSQRALAPNLDHTPEMVMHTSSNTDPRSRPPGIIAQGSPQDRSQPVLAPARQGGIASNPAGDGPNGRQALPMQPSRSQPGMVPGQIQPMPYGHPDADRMRSAAGNPRDAITSLQSLQSKRPRSISEQDRQAHEQPPKRQGLSLEEFTNATAKQHEMQHRVMNRSDSQQGYDYRQAQAKPYAGYPQAVRTASNPEDLDRNRGRAPSPTLYHDRREMYGGVQYAQNGQIIQPSGSMSSVYGGPRNLLGSPGQHAPAELPRPSSGATNTTSSSNRPTPAPPQKRSNIMSLLNDDPPEEKKIVDTRPPAPVRIESPMTNAPLYQTPPQQTYQRREVVDPVRDNTGGQRGYPQPPYSLPTSQPQNYGGSQSQPFAHPNQGRDQYSRSYYPEVARPQEQSRNVYQQPPQAVAPSPPPGPKSSYSMSRPNYENPPQNPGPMPSHSRGSSYSMHPNASVGGPGQALQSSRYASMALPLSMQPIGHHASQPPSTSQQPIYHPVNQGPPNMPGGSRGPPAYPGQLTHEQRRGDDGIRRYGTPSQTPPNGGGYGYAPPQ